MLVPLIGTGAYSQPKTENDKKKTAQVPLKWQDNAWVNTKVNLWTAWKIYISSGKNVRFRGQTVRPWDETCNRESSKVCNYNLQEFLFPFTSGWGNFFKSSIENQFEWFYTNKQSNSKTNTQDKGTARLVQKIKSLFFQKRNQSLIFHTTVWKLQIFIHKFKYLPFPNHSESG